MRKSRKNSTVGCLILLAICLGPLSAVWKPFLIVLAVALAVFVVFEVVKSIAQKGKRAAEIASRKSEFARVTEDFARRGILPEVNPCPILIQQDEKVVWLEQAKLWETRAVRHSQRGVSSSSQEWSQIATGQLVLTTNRLVFDAAAANRTIPLNKVLSIQATSDGDELHIASSSRQKEMAFSSRNAFLLAWMIKLLSTRGK